MKIIPPSAPIPLIDAEAYTQNWRNFNNANMVNGNPLSGYLANAFTFDLQDINDLMNEPGVAHVRIYFGYDNASPSPSVPPPMKVMLVGVDSEGNDIIYSSEAQANSGIYDFAIPCPPTCDSNSPLS